MVTIHRATREDTPTIARLHAASIRELGRSHYDDRQVRAWAGGKRPERYPVDEEDEYVVVAEVDRRLAGYGHLRLEDGEVRAVYVHPDFARRGIGSALLSHLESTAREDGHVDCYLYSSCNAVGFYERAGWTVVAAETIETTGDGVTAELVVRVMEKEL
ncbi:GNAT family N-acetyltransferase [Haloarchaeobius sp. TZWWS8]|uniref:GNAT family N-acetyltransferase n=1 Tax=Haloarchaeobius sp. TZWWS8 TaxID=3446121 RepID=UPI003EB923C7